MQLVSSLTRLDLANKENMLFFVGIESVEANLLKLETSCAMILRPTVTVL